MSDRALIAGIAVVGMGIVGAGVTYVIDYERRISLLESRLDLLTGIQIGTASSNGDQADSIGQSNTQPGSSSQNEFKSAIDEGCATLIMTYNSIINEDSFISIDDQKKLDAIDKQINALSCSAN